MLTYTLPAPDALGAQLFLMEIIMKRVPLLGAAIALFALPLLTSLPASAVGEGEVCGGFVNAQCDKGLFCEYSECSASAGVCEKIPDVCELDQDKAKAIIEVCGCDGETYKNDCERKRAGARKDHDGPCKKKPE
jgi:hypothetical protein